MEHPNATSSVSDDWDENWKRYASAASANPAQQMRYSLVAELLKKGVGGAKARVLDIGSGQGDLLQKLSTEIPAAELVGFEMSSSGVEISKRKVPTARFQIVDLFTPPKAAVEFNGWANQAICSEVLEHVDSPEDFLKAARVFLADDCQLVVTVPSGPMSAFDRHIGHRQHFTRRKITTMLKATGFRVERVYLAGFPFFNLYRLSIIARGRRLVHGCGFGKYRCLVSRRCGGDGGFSWFVSAKS